MDDLKFMIYMVREDGEIPVAAFVALFDARDFLARVMSRADEGVTYRLKERLD